MSKQPTVLVTGGAGYVGSHVCKALHRSGFMPVTLDNLSTGHQQAVKWGPLEVGDVRNEGLNKPSGTAVYLPSSLAPRQKLDLFIRTSGEQRLSNYLLWQCAYSEFVFREELWPDFSREAFEASLAEYEDRKRRFGARE